MYGAGGLAIIIFIAYFILNKKMGGADMKQVKQLTQGTKTGFSMEVAYQKLYVIYMKIPIIKRYLLKIRRRLEITNLEDEYLTRGQASKMLTTTGIMALVTGLASYLTLSEKTSPLEKWITLIGSLTAGVIAATVALKAFKVAKMSAFGIGGLVAGIGLTLGSTIIPAFGDGGLPERGGLFIANEKGPELVGNFGNGTAVANNDMIVAAIEEAAYRGVSRAYAENGRSEEIIVPLSINGREFARATYSDFEKEGRRRG